MTTKNYLRRVLGIDWKIELLTEQVKSLTSLPIYRSPTDVRGRVQGGIKADSTADPAIKTIERCEEIKAYIAELSALKSEYIAMISALDSPEEIQVLICRYLQGMRLDTISVKMCYSYETIRKLSSKAVKHFEERWGYKYLNTT